MSLLQSYQLLPGGSLTLTEGFTFEASGSGTLSVSTIAGDEVFGATQYELNDHLGNVRISVMNESSAVTFDASMEADKAAEEEQYFMNMESRYLDAAFNHTAVGSYSSKLNPMDAGHTYTIGPAIDLEVSPGDTVRMEVFAQYITPISDVNDVVTAMASAIAGSFGFISPLGESAALADAVGTALAGGAAVPNTDRQGAPKAYIQYIVFNKNMTMAQHGYSMVTDEALANWQKLELEVPIEENGYIYIYVANESKENVDVYFDDMEVQLIDAPVTGASDYYPFGLAMAGRSYSSEKYRFGYQGQFAEMDEETGWNSFELRMFEPVIGRWMVPDPYGQYYSPYLGLGNKPLRSIDSDGGVVWLLNIFDGRISIGDGIGGTGSLFASIALDHKGNFGIVYGGGFGLAYGTPGGTATAGVSLTVFIEPKTIEDIYGLGFAFGIHHHLDFFELPNIEANFAMGIDRIYSGTTIGLPKLDYLKPFKIGGGAGYAEVNWTLEGMENLNLKELVSNLKIGLSGDQIGEVMNILTNQLNQYYGSKSKIDLNVDLSNHIHQQDAVKIGKHNPRFRQE